MSQPSPDERAFIGLSSLLIVIKLAGWLDGQGGLHSRAPTKGAVSIDVAPRTMLRWLRRALPRAMAIQQAIREAVIERYEPRPIEQMFPSGLPPPDGLLRRRWKEAAATVTLWRGFALLFGAAIELDINPALILAEARGRMRNQISHYEMASLEHASWERKVAVCPLADQPYATNDPTQRVIATAMDVAQTRRYGPFCGRREETRRWTKKRGGAKRRYRATKSSVATWRWTRREGSVVSSASNWRERSGPTSRGPFGSRRRPSESGCGVIEKMAWLASRTKSVHCAAHRLTVEQSDLCCALKREVPERSLDRILKIVEEMKLIEPGALTRSTLHRVLQRANISGRPPAPTSDTDLDRFEADFPNELWQSNMLTGPWLPDPEQPGKMRRAYLYAFVDDHSRLLLHGRFSFKGDLPALELVFRRCLQRFGLCRRCYYDNGATYRAKHMKHIVGELGIHPIIYTQRHRPMGHGKIEALNRLIRSAFLAELEASSITTLDALNEAFLAWADGDYNRRSHSETGQAPLSRWRDGLDKIEYADEEKLRLAFLWREERTADKAGCLSLFSTRYQIGTELARRKVELRYDPEVLHEIEVWHKGHFVERIKPFEVQRHRRPKPNKSTEAKTPVPATPPPTADWLGHLVRSRRAEHFIARADARNPTRGM